MRRRIGLAVSAAVLVVIAVVLWVTSRTTTTVTEEFPSAPGFDGLSVTYDSTHVSGPLTALAVVASAIAVHVVLRLVRSHR